MSERILPKRRDRKRPRPSDRAEFVRRCYEAARMGALRVRHEPARLYIYRRRLPVSPGVLWAVLEHVRARGVEL